MRIYTKRGDDGTTGLLFGGRVPKDAAVIEANGAVDEAQACLGLARAELAGAGIGAGGSVADRGRSDRAASGEALEELLVGVERDLYVLMAEVACAPGRRDRLEPGRTAVSAEMVDRLERAIDRAMEAFEMPKEFVVPGQTRLGGLLDVARTVVRRAERRCVGVVPSDSLVVPYLNRLSDLCWALAREVDGGSVLARTDDGSGLCAAEAGIEPDLGPG
jgi:cob(I)alamin adenosyltransferase